MRLSTLLSFFCLVLANPLRGDAPAPQPLCYFIPPQGWEIAKLLKPSPFIQVGFIGKATASFRPSINLAFEEVDVNLKDYVKAVKEIHLAEPGTQCRDLGKFPMQAGEGRLLEITSTSSHGEMKQFQALFVKDNTAYILTAAVLKEALPKIQMELIQSLKSLQLVPDLLSPLSDSQKKAFNELFAKEIENLRELPGEKRAKSLSRLEKILAEQFSDLGPHWRFLALNQMHAKLFPAETR